MRRSLARGIAAVVGLGLVTGCRLAGAAWDEVKGGSSRLGAVGSAGLTAGGPTSNAELSGAVRFSQTVGHGNLDFSGDLGLHKYTVPTIGNVTLGSLGGDVHVNLFGGYPIIQSGVFVGHARYVGDAGGFGTHAGIAFATSHARGQRVQLTIDHEWRRIAGVSYRAYRIGLASFVNAPGLVHRPPNALNVTESRYDANGLPRNPSWLGTRTEPVILPNHRVLPVAQVDASGECRFYFAQSSRLPMLIYRPDCTEEVLTLNQVSFRHPPEGGITCSARDAEPFVRGHVNWFDVTQTGLLRYFEFQGGKHGDRDVNLWIEAPGLVTRGNVISNRRIITDRTRHRTVIETEFSGLETFGQFSAQDGGPLWQPLIDLVQRNDAAGVQALIGDRQAVITGLLNLDGVHWFQAELHPVWGLAIDVSHQEPASQRQQWIWFLRNIGNQGECGDGLMGWRSDTANVYFLELPWDSTARDVRLDPASRAAVIAPHARVGGRGVRVGVEVDSGRAVRIVARLPDPAVPESAVTLYGTLRLQWLRGDATWTTAQGRDTVSVTPNARVEHADDHKVVGDSLAAPANQGRSVSILLQDDGRVTRQRAERARVLARRAGAVGGPPEP